MSSPIFASMYLLVGIRSGGQAKFSIGMSVNLNRRGCVMRLEEEKNLVDNARGQWEI